jgi:hypothetical protein
MNESFFLNFFFCGRVDFLSSAGQFRDEKEKMGEKMQRGTPPHRFLYHQSLPPALLAFLPVSDQPLVLASGYLDYWDSYYSC